ncbi:hypothetical protein ACEE23_01880 [Corynebacterium sp. 32222D000AT]
MTDIQKYDSNPAPMAAASTTETDGTRALQNLEAQAQAMGNAMKIAEAMCSTAMVPKQFQGKPADGAAAILYGAELGLNAIQSLQQIMVINGKPGIETRTAVALLKNQGYEIRTVESSDESVTVEGVGPRGEHEVSTWDMKRATTAGYTSNSLYKKIPAQMLYSKAAMEVARKIAPHVLSGIGYSTEELRLDAVNMTAARRDDSRGVSQVRAALAAKKKEHPEPQAEEEDQFVKDVKVALAELTTPEDVTSFMQEIRQDSNVPEVVIDLGRQRWNELQEEEK